jgi:hypothetical protein
MFDQKQPEEDSARALEKDVAKTREIAHAELYSLYYD